MPQPTRHPTSLEAAYRTYGRRLFGYLLRRTGCPHEAEELTQQVFLEAAARLREPGWQPDCLRAWLYTVADRRFVDSVRHRARVRHAEELTARHETMSASDAERAVAAGALAAAIGRLPSGQREVVVLKVLEGRSFAEIAARCDSTEGACKMRFARAIRLVRGELDAAGLGPELSAPAGSDS